MEGSQWASRLAAEIRGRAGIADDGALPKALVVFFGKEGIEARFPEVVTRCVAAAEVRPAICVTRQGGDALPHVGFVNNGAGIIIAAHPSVPLAADGLPDLRILQMPPSRWAELAPERAPRIRGALPSTLPQQTFAELKAVTVAYADAPAFRNWRGCEGEIDLVHEVPGAALYIRLTGTEFLRDRGLPCTMEALIAEVQRTGFPAALLFNLLVGWLLQKNVGGIEADIDDLIEGIGWKPHDEAERMAMRRRVWGWMIVFDRTMVIGVRRGRYRDREGRILDLTSHDSLIRITGVDRESGAGAYDAVPPQIIGWTTGRWLEKFLWNRQVLTDFGDLRRLAAIPEGKPAGAWAQSIGMALQQLWRERASRAEVEDGAVDCGPFTRRKLLDLFRVGPNYQEILDSDHSGRARQYWDAAVGLLKEQGVIGPYRELRPITSTRRRWRWEWLDQPLDIQPGEYALEAMADLAGAGKEARRKSRRKPKPKRAR